MDLERLRMNLENEKRELQNLSRTELEDRIQQYCYNSNIDILTQQEFSTFDEDELRTMVSILNDDLFTLFRDHRTDPSNPNDKRYCHLLKELFEYIRAHAISVEPITRRPYTTNERRMIIDAMKVFFPERMEEIIDAEQFVIGNIQAPQAFNDSNEDDLDQDEDEDEYDFDMWDYEEEMSYRDRRAYYTL